MSWSGDTLGIGIVNEDGNILANEKSTYTTEQGGIIPRKAVEHHVLFYDFILKRALQASKLTLKDIDLVAFSRGPGLGGCLKMGASAARALCSLLKKPIIGVNHIIAHIEIARLTAKFKDPIILFTSGANTQIITYISGRYRIASETLDVGVGNFLDSFGRALNLGFPAGPKVEELASNGTEYIELPYAQKGMDFTFSGIQTKLEQLIASKKYTPENMCYSTQETVFAMLTEATERAIAQIDKKEIILTGGVAANKRLAQMLQTMAEARDVKFAVVPKDLSGDQGAMIAWQGILEYKARGADTETKPIQGWRTDDVDVTWIK